MRKLLFLFTLLFIAFTYLQCNLPVSPNHAGKLVADCCKKIINKCGVQNWHIQRSNNDEISPDILPAMTWDGKMMLF